MANLNNVRIKVTLQRVDEGATFESCRRMQVGETVDNAEYLNSPMVYVPKFTLGSAGNGVNARAFMKYLEHLEEGTDVSSVNTAINAL